MIYPCLEQTRVLSRVTRIRLAFGKMFPCVSYPVTFALGPGARLGDGIKVYT